MSPISMVTPGRLYRSLYRFYISALVTPVKTSLVDISREPVRPVYTLDLLFIC